MRADLYIRALNRAVEILGGRKQLAAYLRVDMESLRNWTAGAVHPPIEILQSVAEILKHEVVKDYTCREPRKRARSKKHSGPSQQ
jgi:predicted transcriptional regulator